MMKKLSLFTSILLFSHLIMAQNSVSISDSNFLKALISKGIDLNSDQKIQTDEAEKVFVLFVDNLQIKDLSGIEAFTSLTDLDCSANKLGLMDISKNTALKNLYCSDNQLTSVNIERNISLLHFHCASNKLTNIDVRKNKELAHIDCHNNMIDSLDLSNNLVLSKLECFGNEIRHLNFTQNPVLDYVWCYSNPYLKEICVTEAQKSKSVSWYKDNEAIWNSHCETGIEEEINLRSNKKLLRMVNLQGQEIKNEYRPNGFYIYQYSDGSVEKIVSRDL